jgi:hypothetical protein
VQNGAFNPGHRQGAGTPFEWPAAVGFGRAPFASFAAGQSGCVAGANGCALGIFGWIDPVALTVSNTLTEGFLLGFVLPVFNMFNWQRVFAQRPAVPCSGPPLLMLRAGLGCVVAVAGDFLTRFPLGAQAGSRVYTDPASGLPYGANPGGFIATPWTVLQSGGCNALLRMSSFVQPIAN